ncbi:MAG: hypothetical protein OXE44_18215 [Nitrospinae bacterium]|nr:hypothetical protein [Nitrospinota bacterium]
MNLSIFTGNRIIFNFLATPEAMNTPSLLSVIKPERESRPNQANAVETAVITLSPSPESMRKPPRLLSNPTEEEGIDRIMRENRFPAPGARYRSAGYQGEEELRGNAGQSRWDEGCDFVAPQLASRPYYRSIITASSKRIRRVFVPMLTAILGVAV